MNGAGLPWRLENISDSLKMERSDNEPDLLWEPLACDRIVILERERHEESAGNCRELENA